MTVLLAEMDIVVKSNGAIRGYMFKWGLETLLRRDGIRYETECCFGTANTKKLKLDIFVPRNEQHGMRLFMCSLKTSLRERWTEAEREASELKPLLARMIPDSRMEFYFITTRAGCDVKDFVEGYNDAMPNVDALVYIDGPEFDAFYERLSNGRLRDD